MRKSSSTASTLAAPARNMAWLSARMILSICNAALTADLIPFPRFMARREQSMDSLGEIARFETYLRTANKFVVIDHASNAAFVSGRPLSADHPSLAAHAHVMIAADNV